MLKEYSQIINHEVAVFCGVQVNVKKSNFLPDIHAFLETIKSNKDVSTRGLEEIIFRVRSKTGLNVEICETIVNMFFNELRNSMLRGDIVTIRGLGKFYISSPICSKNKERVFPKFKPYKKLIKRMNGF